MTHRTLRDAREFAVRHALISLIVERAQAVISAGAMRNKLEQYSTETLQALAQTLAQEDTAASIIAKFRIANALNQQEEIDYDQEAALLDEPPNRRARRASRAKRLHNRSRTGSASSNASNATRSRH